MATEDVIGVTAWRKTGAWGVSVCFEDGLGLAWGVGVCEEDGIAPAKFLEVAVLTSVGPSVPPTPNSLGPY